LQVIDNILDLQLRYRWKPGLILADRCIYDTLVDLAVDTGLDGLIVDRLGPWLVRRLPRPHLAILLDRSPRLVLQDRPDALLDRHFARRRALYERLAARFGLAIVRNDGPPETTLAAILQLIAAGEP
jgi:thymidylate kinase